MIHLTFPTIAAAAIPNGLRLEDWGRVLLVSIPLLAALFAGMAVIHHARRQVGDRPPTKDEQLAEFREAHEAGEIDDAEFRRVSELILGPSQPKRADLVRRPRATGADRAERPAEAEPPRPDQGPASGRS